MPVRRVSAHLFQTFHPHHLPADWSVCRPKSPPVQRAQWSLFWVTKLSGLIAPIGPTSFPDRGECLDRQILVAKHVKNRCVCAVGQHTGVQTRTHTPSGPVRVYQGALFPASRVLGEDFSCHTTCSLEDSDETNTEGAGMETLALWIHIELLCVCV